MGDLSQPSEVEKLAFRLTAHGIKSGQHTILGLSSEGLLENTLFNLMHMSVPKRKEHLRWLKKEEKKLIAAQLLDTQIVAASKLRRRLVAVTEATEKARRILSAKQMEKGEVLLLEVRKRTEDHSI
jgi:hypothetical protein